MLTHFLFPLGGGFLPGLRHTPSLLVLLKWGRHGLSQPSIRLQASLSKEGALYPGSQGFRVQ